MWISPLIVTPKKVENLKQLSNELYNLANAHGYLVKDGAASTSGYSLAGRLVASKSGRLLLEVPNALVRGVFDALHEPGAELPTKSDGQLNAHILVMDKDELAKLGGPEKITERGHYFRYTLGSIYSVKPDGWPEMSKVWFLKVRSPELQKLRRTYGLSSLPNEGKHDFHIIVAVRRTNVLHENEVSKAAGVDDTISRFPEVTENVLPNEVSVPAAEAESDITTEKGTEINPLGDNSGPIVPYSMKRASWTLAALWKLLSLGATKAIRSARSPLRNYYANLAREGLRAGFDRAEATIAPRLRWTVGSTFGPVSGVHDYEFSRTVGDRLRAAYDKLRARLGNKLPEMNFEQGIQQLQQLRQRKNDPKVQQFLRLMFKNMPEYLRNIVETGQFTVRGMAQYQPRSPLIRHLTDALNPELASNAAVQMLRNRMSSTARPSFEGTKSILANAALGAAKGALTGDPLDMAIHVGREAAVLDAPLLNLSQRNKWRLIRSLKGRLILRGMRQAETPPGISGRALNFAANMIDPGIGELISAGYDVERLRQIADQRTSGTHGALLRPHVNKPFQDFRAKLEYHSSVPGIVSNFKHDVLGTTNPSTHRAPEPTPSAKEIQSPALHTMPMRSGPVHPPTPGHIKTAAERIPLKVIGHYEPQMKVKRNAFLYQDPRGDPDKFATCETCHDFTGKSCENFAKGNTVKPTASCGLYRYGPNNRPKPGNETGTFTKAQAGYIEKPVRCENCAFGDIEEGKEAYCELFEHLNKEWPAVFDLDKKIEPKGCCNAFVPKGDKIKKEATLKEAVGYGLMKQAVAKANTQLIKEALGPVGWGLLSAGALASAGISAARGMRLSTPSFLDLGHQMWTTPSNRDELSRALGDVAPAVFDLAHNKPRQFRKLLSGEPVEGFTPELQEKVRTLTFRQAPKPASLGDVRITAGPPENFFKRYWNTVTGGPATHADIGDPEGNWRGLFARTSIDAPVMRGGKLLESGKYLIKPWREPVMKGSLNIRLRLRDMPSQDITEQGAKEFWKLWKKKYRFNFPMFAGAAGHEVLPEAGQAASFLPKIMTQTPGIKHILAKIMTPKTYAHLQAAGISSNKAAEICSSLIAKTLDKINPNVLQRMQAQWPTPNEFLRQTGPGGIFDVKGMQLSPEMTTPEALAAQHRKKYGPLKLRLPLIVGLLGLGGYGAYRAIKSAAIHDAPVVQVKKRTSAHDVWICPHCGDEIDEKSLYRDVKGWYFHRPCFMKGKGSIRLPEKRAYSGALGSGATSGQSTDPPRLVDATGSTPAGAENQPASDALAAYDGDYDHDEFILDRVGIDRAGRITHGESTYQDSGTIQAGGKAEAPSSTGNRSYASAGFSAPEVSITPPAGQLPHLNA
jgi:hypothetical protein